MHESPLCACARGRGPAFDLFKKAQSAVDGADDEKSPFLCAWLMVSAFIYRPTREEAPQEEEGFRIMTDGNAYADLTGADPRPAPQKGKSILLKQWCLSLATLGAIVLAALNAKDTLCGGDTGCSLAGSRIVGVANNASQLVLTIAMLWLYPFGYKRAATRCGWPKVLYHTVPASTSIKVSYAVVLLAFITFEATFVMARYPATPSDWLSAVEMLFYFLSCTGSALQIALINELTYFAEGMLLYLDGTSAGAGHRLHPSALVSRASEVLDNPKWKVLVWTMTFNFFCSFVTVGGFTLAAHVRKRDHMGRGNNLVRTGRMFRSSVVSIDCVHVHVSSARA